MTALYAASREALAEGLAAAYENPYDNNEDAADHLIDSGVVRVIDPDDAALVERLAEASYPRRGIVSGAEWQAHLLTVRAVLRAQVEDQP